MGTAMTSSPGGGRTLRGLGAQLGGPNWQADTTGMSAGSGNAGPSREVDLTQFEPPGRAGSNLERGGRRPALTVAPPTAPHGAQLTVPAVARGVPLSRHLVREVCRLLGLDGVADIAELLTSELVTNAVLHAETESVCLVVEVGGSEVIVSVADSDNRPPRLRVPDAASAGGRGLHLLDSLAEHWGVTEWPDGKAVWFTLSVRPGAPEE